MLIEDLAEAFDLVAWACELGDDLGVAHAARWAAALIATIEPVEEPAQ